MQYKIKIRKNTKHHNCHELVCPFLFSFLFSFLFLLFSYRLSDPLCSYAIVLCSRMLTAFLPILFPMFFLSFILFSLLFGFVPQSSLQLHTVPECRFRDLLLIYYVQLYCSFRFISYFVCRPLGFSFTRLSTL